MTRPVIALLSDFGLRDTYVGVMKGVIKGICPDADLIDLTHEVRPQAVAEAAFLLAVSHTHFPDGTLFLCVVDPGVGSDRAAIVVETERHRFVAPDNGLLSLIWRQAEEPAAHSIVSHSHRLTEVSATFHGRDIFAPAAAHLAAGVPVGDLGPRIPEIEQLAFIQPHREGRSKMHGAILHADHFGNLVTNIRRADLPAKVNADAVQIELGEASLRGIFTTYSSVAPEAPLAHWGSGGFLEIAVRGGSAAERFGLKVGDRVSVSWAA